EERYQNIKDLQLDLKSLREEMDLKAQLGKMQPANRPHRLEAAGKRLAVVLLYKRKAQPDEQLLQALEARLTAIGHDVFIDRHLKIGVEWAQAIEGRIRSADAVIALLSDSAAGSEMLEYELETATDEHRKRGKPQILPVRIGSDQPLSGLAGAILQRLHYCSWHGPGDDARVIAEVVAALEEPLKPKSAEIALEPVGGAVPPGSPFYVERRADPEFLQA